MSDEPNNQFVFANDGDTVVIVAKTPGPTVSDPCDEYPYVSQAYRVVADRHGCILALVPLAERATRVSQQEIDRYVARKENERAEDDKKKIGAVIDQFVGWIHPSHADEVAEWIRYKWNYKWTVANS